MQRNTEESRISTMVGKNDTRDKKGTQEWDEERQKEEKRKETTGENKEEKKAQ